MSHISPATDRAEASPVAELVPASEAEQGAALVSFDIVVHVRRTCVQDCHVGDTQTTVYLGDLGTSATITLADPALLRLAGVAAEMVGTMLSERAVSAKRVADRRPVAEPPEPAAPHPAIAIDAAVAVAGGCPMSGHVEGTTAQIVVQDSRTLCLAFDERALLEFALLTSHAARTVQARAGSTVMADHHLANAARPAIEPFVPGQTEVR